MNAERFVIIILISILTADIQYSICCTVRQWFPTWDDKPDMKSRKTYFCYTKLGLFKLSFNDPLILVNYWRGLLIQVSVTYYISVYICNNLIYICVILYFSVILNMWVKKRIIPLTSLKLLERVGHSLP